MAETNSAVLTETLGVFDGATPLGTSEVADALDVSRRSAYDRLARLAERGAIETKKVGARGRVWWREPDDTDREPVGTAGTEPTRGQLASLLDDVPGVVYRCQNDSSWAMSFVSEGCREVTGYDPGAITSGEVSYGDDVVHPVDYDRLGEQVAAGLADDGEFTVQYRILTPDGETRWVGERGHGVGDGAGGYDALEGVITDITDQKDVERQLREERDFSDRLLAAAPSSITVYEADGRIVRANERAVDLLGLERRTDGTYALEGVTVADAEGDRIPESEWPYRQVFDTGEPVEDWRGRLVLPDRGERWVTVDAEPITGPDGDVERVVVSSSDVTRLKRQAAELARERDELAAELDEVYARIDDAFFAVDEDWRFTYVNDEGRLNLWAAMGNSVDDVEEGDVVGRHLWEAIPEAVDTPFYEHYTEAMKTGESTTFEAYFPLIERWYDVGAYPSETGLSVYFRDVTDRKERERELERYERIVENLPAGVYRRHPGPRGEFVEANPGLAAILGADSVDALFDHDVSEFYPDSTAREAFSDRVLDEGTVHNAELRQETLDGEEIWISVTAIAAEEDDETVFDGIVQDVTERKERQRQLRRQRERLAALNHLNAVVRDVNEALVRESTRSEMERAVCGRLAGSDSYVAAWVGGTDPRAEAVEPRVAVGGDWDDSPDDPEAGRPERATLDLAAEAIRTKEIQVVTDVTDEADDWGPVARRHDASAVAAIPVVHEDTVYGVLVVYADREGAFADEERAVIAQLGELIGHAIAAAERKQALMSDTVVELEFHVDDVLGESGTDDRPDSRIELNETVPVGGGDYLVYGRVSADADETLDRVADRLDHWESVTVLADEAGESRFELLMSEPPIVSTVAAHGGYVERATIEDGDFAVTVHLPQTAETRRIIDAVLAAYPTAEMVARRQVSRQPPRQRVERALREDLTERQRTALEASFHAGFFEWPRESDGAAVADSLGISSPTFHQHLRAAERKLLTAILA